MPAISVRRISDNLLYVADYPPNLPKLSEQTICIENAVRALGGVAADWQFITLNDAQYHAMEGQMGRAYLQGGNIVIKSMNLSSDKASIAADGVEAATISADVGDANYTGEVKFTVIAPDGSSSSSTVNAVAGIAVDTVTTEQADTHIIRAECVEFGVAEITLEGV
jgi:hypothetical protein